MSSRKSAAVESLSKMTGFFAVAWTGQAWVGQVVARRRGAALSPALGQFSVHQAVGYLCRGQRSGDCVAPARPAAEFNECAAIHLGFDAHGLHPCDDRRYMCHIVQRAGFEYFHLELRQKQSARHMRQSWQYPNPSPGSRGRARTCHDEGRITTGHYNRGPAERR